MCCLCQPWQPPLHTPAGLLAARASASPPPSLAPCRWGWRLNHPPTRPASPLTLPPSSFPPSSLLQVFLLENSRQMSAVECWACGPGDEPAAWPQHGGRPWGRQAPGLLGDSRHRAAAPGGWTPMLTRAGLRLPLPRRGFSWPLFSALLCPAPAELGTQKSLKPGCPDGW